MSTTIKSVLYEYQKSNKKLYIPLCIWQLRYYYICKVSIEKKRLLEKSFFKVWKEEHQTVSGAWILALPLTLTYHVVSG